MDMVEGSPPPTWPPLPRPTAHRALTVHKDREHMDKAFMVDIVRQMVHTVVHHLSMVRTHPIVGTLSMAHHHRIVGMERTQAPLHLHLGQDTLRPPPPRGRSLIHHTLPTPPMHRIHHHTHRHTGHHMACHQHWMRSVRTVRMGHLRMANRERMEGSSKHTLRYRTHRVPSRTLVCPCRLPPFPN